VASSPDEKKKENDGDGADNDFQRKQGNAVATIDGVCPQGLGKQQFAGG
jgi:hypothetical protein